MHRCEACGADAAYRVKEWSQEYGSQTFLYCEACYRKYRASGAVHSFELVNGYREVMASSGRRRAMPPFKSE